MTFNERVEKAKSTLYSIPNIYDMMVTHSKLRDILDILRDPEEKPKEKDPFWCEHFTISGRRFVMQSGHQIDVDSDWKCCPVCGKPRP